MALLFWRSDFSMLRLCFFAFWALRPPPPRWNCPSRSLRDLQSFALPWVRVSPVLLGLRIKSEKRTLHELLFFSSLVVRRTKPKSLLRLRFGQEP